MHTNRLRACSIVAILLSFLCFLPQATAQSRYTVTWVRPLPGGLHTDCYGLNNLGYVVGNTAFIGAPPDSATIWRGGMPERIGVDYFVPRGINDTNEIVGDLYNEAQAVTFAQGVLQRLPALPGLPNSAAYGINGIGSVVGYCYDPAGTSLNRGRATLWNNGLPTEIPPPPNRPYSIAIAISNSGQVVGFAEDKTGGFRGIRAFSWTVADGTIDLQTFDGGTTTIAYGVNNLGQVVGLGDTAAGPRAFIWAKGTGLTSLDTLVGDGYSEAFGINDAGQVVGNSYGLDGGQWQPHPFIWKDGEYFKNLNELIDDPTNVWRVAFAQAINNQGQILCRGYRLDDPLLGSQFLLLSPIQPPGPTPVAYNKFSLNDDQGKPVVGIVCDNLRGMDKSLLNRLVIQSDYLKGATITEARLVNDRGSETDDCPQHHKNAGDVERTPDGLVALDQTAGQITYYPPDEFNYEQEPEALETGQITSAATRSVRLYLKFRKSGTDYALDGLPITLARPPVVLVHGINNTQQNWWPLMYAIQEGLGKRIGFALVDHHNSFHGNGPVEFGATVLADTIQATLGRIRNAEPLPNGEAEFLLVPVVGGFEKLKDFSDYMRAGALAIRRVDLIGWSYGGMIARWYIASDGSDPSMVNDPIKSWYMRTSYYTGTDPFPPIPATTYANDVRKLITLGSMWRGVPLANYANEARFSHEGFPAVNGTDLFEAPLAKDVTGLAKLGRLMTRVLDRSVPTAAPSIEVMAVESRWLRHIIYHKNSQPEPFNSEIAYGSVAGDDNNYPIKGFEPDPYKLINRAQTPSWFPGLLSEVRNGSNFGFTDGIVPVWSSAIPGSYAVVQSDHAGYVRSDGTRSYVLQFLSNHNVMRGKALNDAWQTLRDFHVDEGREWSFVQEKMGPTEQRSYYQQIGGIGRINPDWLAIKDDPDVTMSSSGLYRDGKTIKVDLTFKNMSSVPGRMLYLRVDRDHTSLGASLTSVNSSDELELGHLAQGASRALTLTFIPDSRHPKLTPGQSISLHVRWEHSRSQRSLVFRGLTVP
jgi:probable HAF family extracellular repeat protein